MKNWLLGEGILIWTVLIWGLGYPYAKFVSDYIDVFPLAFMRAVVSAVMIVLLTATVGRRSGFSVKGDLLDFKTARTAIVISLFSTAGMLFQMLGITMTTATNASFITTVNVLLIPFVSAVLFKTRIEGVPTVGLMLSTVGFMLISGLITLGPSGITVGISSVNRGDIFVLVCAVCFSVQVSMVNHYSRRYNYYALFCWDALVKLVSASFLWGIATPGAKAEIANPYTVPALIVLSGLGGQLALVLLAAASQKLSAAKTAVILALEPVFGAFFSAMIPDGAGNTERMTGSQLVGGAVIFACIVGVELIMVRRQSKAAEV